jgi:CRISPR-associated Csx2 family protein
MNSLKAISFLGVNAKGYTLTNYSLDAPHLNEEEKNCSTDLFQEALVQFYKPKILYVFLTKQARIHQPENASEPTWETLRKRLSSKVDIIPVYDVPEGNDDASIWNLFNKIVDCLDENDQVVFDITHAFRSIPVISLVAVSYLRVVRQVSIKGLVYGLFNPRSPEDSPTFDLLPIVSLLEWTTATDQFLKTGNGDALANLLCSENVAIQDLANNIEAISKGLQLLRPVDVMTESANLENTIKSASLSISQSVPPFAALLKRIEKDYGKFGLKNSSDFMTNGKISLLNQLKMIDWYTNKGQIVQALSLAREWLPSLLCWYFKLDPFIDKPNREEMEILLSGGKRGDRQSIYLDKWNAFPKQMRNQLINLWQGKSNLANLRNDALHSGFRKNPRSADEIILETRQIIQELQLVAKNWKLEE